MMAKRIPWRGWLIVWLAWFVVTAGLVLGNLLVDLAWRLW